MTRRVHGIQTSAPFFLFVLDLFSLSFFLQGYGQEGSPPCARASSLSLPLSRWLWQLRSLGEPS